MFSENEKESIVKNTIHAASHLIEKSAKAAELPVNFAASKLIEGDALIAEKLDLDQNDKEMAWHIVKKMEMQAIRLEKIFIWVLPPPHLSILSIWLISLLIHPM